MAASLVLTAVACGGKSPPPSAPAAESAAVDDLVTPSEAERTASAAPADTARPMGPTLVAGHADARYEFTIPRGLSRLRGMLAKPGEDPRELSEAGPDGVGLPSFTSVSYDSIGVFSDPRGLGVDMGAVPAAERDRIVKIYGEVMLQRFPSATAPLHTSIGPHAAIRIDVPRIEMPDRPVRSGRHYLILDGRVTVSVDCLWTEANAAQMSEACDAVASSLRRHSPASK